MESINIGNLLIKAVKTAVNSCTKSIPVSHPAILLHLALGILVRLLLSLKI